MPQEPVSSPARLISPRKRQIHQQQIDDDLQTFEQVRSFVGKHFRINNIEIVTPPEWEYDLLS
jgi:hypothetical protein